MRTSTSFIVSLSAVLTLASASGCGGSGNPGGPDAGTGTEVPGLGAEETLATAQDPFGGVFAGGGVVYWRNASGGGTPEIRSAKGPSWTVTKTALHGWSSLVPDGDQLFYSDVDGASKSRSIFKAPHGETSTMALYATEATRVLAGFHPSGDRLYVADDLDATTTSDPRLSWIPKSGGAPTIVPSDGMVKMGFMLNATHLFYFTAAGFVRQPLAGGAAEKVDGVPGSGTPLMVTDTAVFWTENEFRVSGKVYRKRLDGGAAEVVDSGSLNYGLQASDSTHAYWVASKIASVGGPTLVEVRRIGDTGTSPQVLGGCDTYCDHAGVAVDDGTVYWACQSPLSSSGTPSTGKGIVKRRAKL